MSDAWLAALLFLALSTFVGASMVFISWLLRVKAKENPPTRTLTYECGEIPVGNAWVRFHPRYYLVALVFVVFDVEVAFLFPWAVDVVGAGLAGIVEVFVFVGVLMLGWAYALKKGALRWQ
jgi:NADH:ubiquinone oxidoreductase subunit 3 (subunit A)